MDYPEQTETVKISLPNSSTVLVLGILSIVMCWCGGIVGLTLGIIALIISAKMTREYTSNTGLYTEISYKNMVAGKICAIIGTCLSGLWLLYVIFYMVIVGTIFSFLPWGSFIDSI